MDDPASVAKALDGVRRRHSSHEWKRLTLRQIFHETLDLLKEDAGEVVTGGRPKKSQDVTLRQIFDQLCAQKDCPCHCSQEDNLPKPEATLAK